MFEYWFLGLENSNGTYTHHGTTHDFLQLVSEVGEKFSPSIAGEFVGSLLEENFTQLSYLRVIDWNFTFEVGEETIKVNKIPR